MDLLKILTSFDIPYKTEGHHHCREGWINIDCPFCGKDTHKWHMGYSIEGNYFNCWRCGHHRLIDTLMEITGLSYAKCKSILKNTEPTKKKKKKPIHGQYKPPLGIGKLLKAHRKYLHDRNFNPQELESLWKIKGIGIANRLSWRIFIPIIYHKQLVSWTTRTISKSNNTTRYISASPKEESIPHKNILYGEDFVRKTIIITEGPFDVWRIGPGAVATLGTNYSNEQMFRMTKYPKRIICFDNEPVAQKQAERLCADLSVFPGDTFNLQLEAKDAASASIKEIKKIKNLLE